jgi:hypothetical protein
VRYLQHFEVWTVEVSGTIDDGNTRIGWKMLEALRAEFQFKKCASRME